jgi:hypothetical protein
MNLNCHPELVEGGNSCHAWREAKIKRTVTELVEVKQLKKTI